MQITIGKLRGLQQISSERGTFTALALDHRQNLRKANPAFVNDEELSHFKLDVTTALASSASAVLLDPEVSAAQGLIIWKLLDLHVRDHLDGLLREDNARLSPIWEAA